MGETKKENEELQLVVFQLGEEEFGVDIMSVQEIIKMTNITRIPQTPPYVRGVINLRGKIIVVIDLGMRLDITSKEETDEHSRIIVVEINDLVVGMMVDSVSEVMRLPKSNIEPAPSVIATKIGAEYLQGVGKVDDRLLILLDLKKVLTEGEMKQVETATKIEATA
jgi:purine-binding chemotaxis protein CheW